MNWNDLSIAELEKRVREHNRRYFVEHKPVISDYEFDRLVEALRQKAPRSEALEELGSDVSGERAEVQHTVPMLSLDKCYDDETLDDWASKFKGDVVASPKIDGCAVALRYDTHGELSVAATRGSGTLGEDITPNVKFIKDIPQKIALKNVEIRGEVYMPLSVFKRYKAEFANPRNLAAGAIKQKDPHKTGDYMLKFWGYEVLGSDAGTEMEKRALLKKNHFPVVETVEVAHDGLHKIFQKFLDHRETYDFETDGVVFRINSVAEQERVGSTTHHPRYAIAYKFQGDSAKTKLEEVEWSVSRSGIITPVGIVRPVQLSGATVMRVSLHHAAMVKKWGLGIGSEVVVMRRGGVIPHLETVITKGKHPVESPRKCPSCGAKVEMRDDFLYCTNPKGCLRTKLGELSHFVKTIDCDGFGEKILEQLYLNELVVDSVDLYTLTVEGLLPLDRMGETLAEKLVRNIQAKRELPLALFLQALGVPELAHHTATILAKMGDLEKILKVSEEELTAIHSIGPAIAKSVVHGLHEKSGLIHKLQKYITISTAPMAASHKLAGKTFLFTGTLVAMERRRAQERVEKNGGTLASGISKALDYLVVGDGGGAGSKLSKAEKLVKEGAALRILSEAQFLRMVT
jgi:DNA ligase (NAD+)